MYIQLTLSKNLSSLNIPIKLLLFNIPVNNRFNSRFVQLGYIIASFKNF